MRVRSVDLHMTNRALPVPLNAQIMKRRRRPSGHTWTERMALQTQLAHVMSRQHTRVRGPMQVMARGTQLRPHRSMLKRERTSLIRMAFEAGQIMSAAGDAERGIRLAPMRLMTIRAVDRPLRQLMTKRTLKRRPYVAMAARTQRIVRPPYIRRMHPVTAIARHSVAGVRGLKPPLLPVILDMTGQARIVHLIRLRPMEQLQLIGIQRLHVRQSGPVAALAIRLLMRILWKRLRLLDVTHSAPFGPDAPLLRPADCPQAEQPDTNRGDQASIGHSTIPAPDGICGSCST